MSTIDLADPAELAASLCRVEPDAFRLTVVGPGSAHVSRFPESWLPIIAAPEAPARREQALALWNLDFLERLPKFHHELKKSLVDVRAVLERDCPALVYVFRDVDRIYTSWIGYDPRTFQQPPFWDSFPPPLQTFLRDVHAGFVAQDYDACGVAPPRYMQTMAEIVNTLASKEGFERWSGIPADRVLIISTNGGSLSYCICPDTPGKLVLLFEGDVDPLEFFEELDKLLVQNLGII